MKLIVSLLAASLISHAALAADQRCRAGAGESQVGIQRAGWFDDVGRQQLHPGEFVGVDAQAAVEWRVVVPAGGDARVEHWVHAQRQGQLAAANMLGGEESFAEVPFFWTHHQGHDLRVSGYLDGWDELRIDGELQRHDFIARYFRDGRLVAAAALGRDRELLEVALELRATAEA